MRSERSVSTRTDGVEVADVAEGVDGGGRCGWGGRGGFGEGEGVAEAGEGAPAGAPQLGGAQDDQDQVDQGLSGGRGAQDVQPVTDRGVLDLAQVAVDVQHEVVEFGRTRLRVDAQVLVQVGGLDQGPDLGPERGQLVRVERGHGGVLIQQLLELGHLAVGVGAGHRRHQVVDDHRVPAPLGLGPLPRVVDDERVHQRQVTEHRVRRALRAQAEPLAGQPLQRAVLAQVDDGVGAEVPGQPAVRGQVVVRRRQVGVVVDGHRVLAEPAWRLDHQHHVPEAQAGQHDVTGALVGVQLTRRGPPVCLDGGAKTVRQIREETAVSGERDPGRCGAELVLGEPLGVVAAGRDQRVDQRVAVLGEAVAEVVAGLAHGAQQRDGRGWRVEPDGIADPGVLGGIGGKHDGDALGGVRGAGQAGVPDRDAGQPGGTFGVGGVARDPVRAFLLERERHGDHAPVELGDRDLHGGVDRGQRGVRCLPLRARAGQAEALQHGHVQAGQQAGVPVALAGGIRGGRAAGREHGGDHRVGRAEQLRELGVR